ncbi:amidohydrolase family protein [Candidatus Bathyarchaeota archaeon]|nr:amidohydrolase family protein [Candidatus Bathyarchaeota archaeon]
MQSTASSAYINGSIITMDPEDNIYSAVAIKGKKILSVGSDEEIEKTIDNSTHVTDLKGRTLLPGFIDSHVHLMGAGRLALKAENEVDIKYCDNLDEVLEKIKQRAEKTPDGEWVIGWGYLWSRYREKRAPLRSELDMVAPNNPVLLKFSAMGVANTAALNIAGITEKTRPDYGHVELGGDGKPNGRLQGGAAVRLVSRYISEYTDNPLEIAKKAINQWVKWGITCAHLAGSTHEDTVTIQRLREKDELDIRWRLYIHNMTDNLDYMDHLVALGIRRGFGDDKVRINGVKLALDSMGSMGNAATYEPSTGNPGSLGILLVEPENLKNMIIKAHLAGLQTATHSIGDRAIDINLDAIEAALKEYPMEDHRHRIEHCTQCPPAQMKRIKELGVHPGESNYIWNFGSAYKYQYGEERSKYLFPYRSFMEHDIVASANSDYGGGPWHGNTLRGIYAMMTRKTEDGETLGSGQAIGLLDAIRCYTLNGAYAGFDEDKLGSIEAGKLADIIILNGNILNTHVEKIPELRVDETIIDGRTVYKRNY